MSLLFTVEFQKKSAAPTSKNQPERAALIEAAHTI
jgi:hypothetical protein